MKKLIYLYILIFSIIIFSGCATEKQISIKEEVKSQKSTQKNIQPKEEVNQIKSAELEKQKVIKDDIVNNSFFENKEFGFSFYYPNNLKIDPDGAVFIFSNGINLFTFINDYDLKNYSLVNSKKSKDNINIDYFQKNENVNRKKYIIKATVKGKRNFYFYLDTDDYQDNKNVNILKNILSSFKILNIDTDTEIKTLKDGSIQYEFISEDLGVKFKYIGKKEIAYRLCKAERNKNKIIVCGQSVEVFNKNKNLTLKKAVEKNFLKDYIADQCFFKEINNKDNDEYGIISFPGSTESLDSIGWENRKNCPDGYTEANGIRYFKIYPDNPDKFVFFDIGQDTVFADSDLTWQETFEFIDK